MNVSKFQLILNHEDPNVVSDGLKEFRDQILIENEAIITFGYCGQIATTKADDLFQNKEHKVIVGLLKAYLNASPQLEELFVLWSLPGHDEDSNLSAEHMSCIAAILHCAVSEQEMCNCVVRRILHEFSRGLRSQLSSGHINVTHSSLGLLITMCRTSSQNCRDTFQKLSDYSFNNLIQKGKYVSWTDSCTSLTHKTDARALIFMLQFLFIESAHQEEISQLLQSSSTFKKLIHSIDKDQFPVVEMVLNVWMYLTAHSSIFRWNVNEFMDALFLEKLFVLCKSHNVVISIAVYEFLVATCHYLGEAMLQKKKVNDNSVGEDHSAISASMCVNQLLRRLQPVVDDRHREVI
jgi:hypothetical protein